MVQLTVLNGSAAGQQFQGNGFPISVGRNSDCLIAVNEPGVFDKHFEIQFSPEGFFLQASPHAVVSVNGATTDRIQLRNGDLIVAGYVKIQFSLGVMPQKPLWIREALTWTLVAAVIAVQVYLVFRLVAMSRP